MKIEDKREILTICQDHGYEGLGSKIKQAYIKSFNPEMISLGSFIEWIVAEEWKNKVLKAKHSKSKLPDNGKLVQCFGYDVDFIGFGESDIGLHLGVTDYEHYTGVRGSLEPRIWSMSTGAITYFRNGSQAERHYIFAARNKNRADLGGVLDLPPGGYLDLKVIPKDLENGCGKDTDKIFIANLSKEFNEELGLSSEKIANVNLLSLMRIGDYYNPNKHELQRFNDTGLFYYIEANTCEEEIDDGFRKSKKEGGKYGGEHSEHFIVPEHKLCDFLTKRKKLLSPRTKMNVAYLLNHDSFMKEE